MTDPDDNRSALRAAAARIESETRGQLPASAFDQLIDAEILPAVRSGALERLLPISVCADKTGTPTTFDKAKPRVGAIAVYEDVVTLAWETSGIVSTGTASYVADRSSIAGAEPWRDVKSGGVGLDVRGSGAQRWSLVCAGSMPQALTQPWVEELAALLGSSGPDAAGAQRRISSESLLHAAGAVDPAARGAGTEAMILRRLAGEARTGRSHTRSLEALGQHADERLAELGEDPFLWSDQGERRAWATVRELVQTSG